MGSLARKINAYFLYLAIPLWVPYMVMYGVNVQLLVITLILYQLTGCGISVGYHRMLTHRAIDPHPTVKYFLTVLGMICMQGPPSHWVRIHKLHHGRADKAGDPHSPKDGFWHAQCGWVVKLKQSKNDTKKSGKILTVYDRQYYWWALGAGLAPLLWSVEAFVYLTLLRVFLVAHSTWIVNSWCHLGRIKNSTLLAIICCGEGYHKNHHDKPRAARLGRIDLGYCLMRLLGCRTLYH